MVDCRSGVGNIQDGTWVKPDSKADIEIRVTSVGVRSHLERFPLAKDVMT